MFSFWHVRVCTCIRTFLARASMIRTSHYLLPCHHWSSPLRSCGLLLNQWWWLLSGKNNLGFLKPRSWPNLELMICVNAGIYSSREIFSVALLPPPLYLPEPWPTSACVNVLCMQRNWASLWFGVWLLERAVEIIRLTCLLWTGRSHRGETMLLTGTICVTLSHTIP